MILLVVLVALQLLYVVSQITLTSQPQTSGTYCPGPVIFTCVGTRINALLWLVNGSTVISYAFQATDVFPLPLNFPLDGVMAAITSASINPSAFFDIASVINVSDVSVLNGTSLQCATSLSQSETFHIQVNTLTTPPSPSSTSCSLLPSPGGAKISLHWSPSFTSQHAVERYRVSVTPDPSCSSDQVSPSEDYSCSGLVLGTSYTFTLSAINCGDQEGNTDTFTVTLEGLAPPTPVFNTISTDVEDLETLSWVVVAPEITGGCGFDPLLNYTVVQEDNTGVIVDKRVVSSDSCSDSCSISFSPSSLAETCRIGVRASNGFGQSDTQYFLVDVDQLTTTNQVLLAIGVVVLCAAIVMCISLIVGVTFRKGSKLSLVLLVVGGVLVVVSVVLWVAVAFQVGLQQNTCDSAWQLTRDYLIISAQVLSIVALLVLVMDLILLALSCSQGNKKETKPDSKPEHRKVVDKNQREEVILLGERDNNTYMVDRKTRTSVLTENRDYAETYPNTAKASTVHQTHSTVSGDHGSQIKMSQNQVYGLRQQDTTTTGSEIPTDSNLLYGLRQQVTTPSGNEIPTDSNLVYGLRQQVTTPSGSETPTESNLLYGLRQQVTTPSGHSKDGSCSDLQN